MKIVDKKIARYWDGRGVTYSKSWQSIAKKRLSDLEVKLVKNTVESTLKNENYKKLRTLDIGVGIGRISQEILKYNVEHYATDVSKTMIDYSRNKFSGRKKVKRIVIHDILNPLPNSWGKFNVITAIRVLSYTKHWKRGLENIYNSLHSGGYLVFTFPNKNSSVLLTKLLVGKKYHGVELNYKQLKSSLEKVGFSEIKIIGFSRLFDTLYDKANTKKSSNRLYTTEKILRLFFGAKLFVRLFYITCKK